MVEVDGFDELFVFDFAECFLCGSVLLGAVCGESGSRGVVVCLDLFLHVLVDCCESWVCFL